MARIWRRLPTLATMPRPSGGSPHLILFAFLLTALVGAGLCVAAIAVPAPAAVAPLVALVCVGAPAFASWGVPGAIMSLRAQRGSGHALMAFRRSLDDLPEVDHPLGL